LGERRDEERREEEMDRKVHERIRKRKRNDERDVHRSEPVHCHIEIRVDGLPMSAYPIGGPARTCNSSLFYFSIAIDRNAPRKIYIPQLRRILNAIMVQI